MYKLLRNIILFYFLFNFLQSSDSQKISEYFANRRYRNLDYKIAANLYEKLHKNHPQNALFIQRLAFSYYEMEDYSKALKYYNKLLNTNLAAPVDYYTYAGLLRVFDSIPKSREMLLYYSSINPDDPRVTTELENLDYVETINTFKKNYVVMHPDGNTEYIDMSPVYYRDNKLVFSSSRKKKLNFIRKKHEWNGQPFLDVYVAPLDTSILENVEEFSSKINTPYHEGPLLFSKDYKKIYFTRNSFIATPDNQDGELVNNLKIFTMDWNGKSWDNLKSLPFNSDNYSVGHPALSPDGLSLFFISDMPGGYGETDIYKAEYNPQIHRWGKPVNLGPTINTPGKEMFPYIDNDSVLYMSSDGWGGYGRMDIFRAKENSNGTYSLLNIGKPLNSNFDDFGLVYNYADRNGFFSSNRNSGEGSDDIYSIGFYDMKLDVDVFDRLTKERIPHSDVMLYDNEIKKLCGSQLYLGDTLHFSLDPEKHYRIDAINKYYKPGNTFFESGNPFIETYYYEKVFLDPLYFIRGIVKDKKSGEIISGATVLIKDNLGRSDSLFSNEQGIFEFEIEPGANFEFYISKEKYHDKYDSFATAEMTPGILEKIELLSPKIRIVLDTIYYDLDKYFIREDAALILNKVAQIMLENPEMEIDLKSHTDSRASNDYNIKLSERRAVSAINYLEQKGINPNRISYSFYGESKLIVNCPDGKNCSEALHQLNRRTEIVVKEP